MTPSSDSPDPTSIRGDGLFHRGPLAIHVAVTVEHDRVQVEPTSRLERLAGARPFDIPLDVLQDVEGSWLRGMSLVTTERAYRFSGSGIKVVYEALKLRLGKGGSVQRLLPGEHELLEGSVERVASPVWIRSSLRLTNRRLLVSAQTGVQSLLPHERTIELPVEWIACFRLESDGQLHIFIDGGPGRTRPPVVLSGGSSARVCAVLLAMGIEEGGPVRPPDQRPPPRPPIVWGPVAIEGATVNRQGFAAVGPGGLGIVADDLVASVAGAELTSLDLEGLQSWRLDDTDQSVLELQHLAGPWTLRFQLTTVDAHAFAQLVARTAPHGARLLDGQHHLAIEDVDELMATASGALPTGRVQQGVGGVAVLYGETILDVRRGWLLLLTAGFLLVDLDETTASFLAGPLIDRTRTTIDAHGRLDMRVDRKPVSVLVVGGEEPARSLWSAFGGRAPEKSEVFAVFPYVGEMLGRLSCLRVARDRRELFSRRMVTTSLEPDGLAFRLPLPVPRRLEVAARVEVELGDDRTVYTFRTDVARIDPVASGEHAVVVLLLAREVERRDNRRQAFRVAIEGEATARKVSEHGGRARGARIAMETVNLSWTGVGLLSASEPPVGQLLRLVLPLEGDTGIYTVQVVQTHKVVGDPRVHIGCRFLDLSRGQQDWLQSVVIRQQMREVAAKELKHEVGEG